MGFKNGRYRVLVATDIAARGIDVKNIELVLNYDLPTIAESGLSNIDMETWFGLFAPAATPAPVLAKLTEAVEKARSSPEAVDIFTKTGGSLKTMGIEETRAFARNEAERWAKLLREAGIRAE